jgi:Glycosyl hydrolases family 16
MTNRALKWIAGAMLAFVVGGPVFAADIDLTGYTLIFEDNFDTLSATTAKPKGSAKWFVPLPYGAKSYFCACKWPDMREMSVKDGILSIKMEKDAKGQWWGGAMGSIDPKGNGFLFKSGYVEARVRMPASGNGEWTAFWMGQVGPDGIPGTYKGPTGEIDIFEWYGIAFTKNTPATDSGVRMSSHCWQPSIENNNTTCPGFTAEAGRIPNGAAAWLDYHIYGFWMDPSQNKMRMYVDGVMIKETAIPDIFKDGRGWYLMLNHAIGGGWPITGVISGSSFDIDWVRAYALPTGDTTPPPPPPPPPLKWQDK